MATDKRERQRANRELRRQQEAHEEKVEQRKQRSFTFALVAVGLLLGFGLLFLATRDDSDVASGDDVPDLEFNDNDALGGADAEGDGDGDTEGDGDAESEGDSEDDGDETGEETASAVSVPEPGGTIDGDTECPPTDGSAERITTFSAPPPMCIDPSGTYTAEFNTTAGTITVELDAEAAPETVNNFVVLSRYRYYEGVPFHRIIPGFVIQGGDAVGPVLGTGNPGYLIDEEPPAEPIDDSGNFYEVGSLAMAKSAGPTATGAQFFFVTGDQGASLPPEYSLFGNVTEGLDVMSAIENIPTTTGDLPTEEILIESVEIVES